MKEIVKYQNNLNLISFKNYNATEMNILFSVFQACKDLGEEEKTLDFQTIKKLVEYDDVNNKLLANSIRSSIRKLAGLNMEFIIQDEAWLIPFFEYIRLPKEWEEKANEPYINFKVNKSFIKIFNGVVNNFTCFELSEFIKLDGKYAKTLYRLLKQFRSTGKLRLKWSEFIRILDIPATYKACDIDHRILKPAIKELTTEQRISSKISKAPFLNLTYNKIKGKGRGRGGNIVGIEFTFTPESEQPTNEDIDKKIEELEGKILEQEGRIQRQYNELAEYKERNSHLELANKTLRKRRDMGKEYLFYENRDFLTDSGSTIRLLSIDDDTDIGGQITVRFENRDTHSKFARKFETSNHFKKYMSKMVMF